MSIVQLFISTYNRPLIVKNAINSALQQTYISVDVIVSDNSTIDDTEILVSGIKNQRLAYIRRKPSLPVIDHFNAILKDVTSEYFMIFHDDDTMYPEMIEELMINFKTGSDIIAVGANAKIITPGIFPDRLMLRRKFKSLIIHNRDEMAHQYLIKRGIVPFPSYLYKCEVAKKLKFNPENGGKHCDVAFLMDLTSLGSVHMLKKPLMDYNISNGQDSMINNFQNRIRLINYIKKTTIYNRDSYLLKRFRVVNLYYEIIQDKNSKHKISRRRSFKILNLLFKVSPLDFFPRALLQLIFR
jgi:glycosyltransferase involved in cell wall biosynthesis